MTKSFLFSTARCFSILFLFAFADASRADDPQDPQGEGWVNILPTDIPTPVDFGSAAAPSTGVSLNASLVVNPLATVAYSGPSATAITPELQALANGLDNDPVKIFNYVHNKIEFQTYYGSHKGAHLTYLDGAGNDMDQASLLIALLNQAGYPNAQYAYGSYTMSDTSADTFNLSNWLGVPKTIVVSALVAGGIPVGGGINYGDHITWVLDHVWVRATINGTSYDLDPSYKQYKSIAPILYKAASLYSRADLLTAAGSTGSSTADYSLNLNRSSVETLLGQYSKNLYNSIKANQPNAEIEDILGGRRIVEQPVSTLSQGAPPTVFNPTVATTFSTIPSQYLATYRVQVGTLIDVTFNLHSLQGNRLSLVFVSNKAQLWLGDTQVATESSSSGTTVNVTLTFTHPYGTVNPGASRTTTTSYSRTGNFEVAYCCYPNPRSSGQVNASNKRLQAYLASGLTDSSRQVLTESLHLLGVKWIRQVSLDGYFVGQTQGDYFVMHHVSGRVAQETGYYVDIASFVSSMFNHPSSVDYPAFNSMMLISSAMEHGVIEQTGTSSAASTVKCLVLANDGGQKIFKATSSNYSSTVQSQLPTYSSAQKTAFSTMVGSGFTLLIHQNAATTLNQWSGFGYAAISGSLVQMMIAGNLNGGYNSTSGQISGGFLSNLFGQASSWLTNIFGVFNPSSIEPVDLLTGAYKMDRTDLTLGEPNSPRGLNFSRSYDSSRSQVNSALGYGWRHSCEGKVNLSSEIDAAFGFTQPSDAAQTIVGIIAASDFTDPSFTPKEWVTGAIAANWTLKRITNNVANVQLGNQTFAYTSQPDGSWNPPPGSTTALTLTSGTFKLLPRFGGSVVFDGSNRISQWKDVDNNTQSFAYTSGTLHTVSDQFGRTLTFNYYLSGSSQGLLQNVTDSTGRVASFTYTGGNLTQTTDPENYHLNLGYDTNHQLTDVKDHSLQWIAHNDFDGLGRVYQQLSQNVHLWKFGYSAGCTLETNPQGGETAYFFDWKNRLVGKTDALGHSSSMAYDGQNHVVQTADPTGRKTTSYFDGDQNLRTFTLTGTDNSVKTTTYQYDTSLRLWKIFDPTQRFIELWYDTENHLSDVWDAGRRHTQYFYRLDGLPDHIIDPANNTTSFTGYDSYGNPTNVTRGDGSTTSSTFNARGDLLTFTDGRLKTTVFTCDKRRLPQTRTDARLKLATWAYDANGYLLSGTDRNNHSVFTPHDNLGHLQTVTATDTATLTLGYDTRDWLTTVTDGLNHTTTNNFDATKRRVSLVNALTITTGSNTFDDAGRLRVQYDGLNHATQYFYDGVGRLDHTSDPLNHTVFHGYDDAGRILTLQNRRQKTFIFGYGAMDGLPTTFNYPSGRQSQIIDREPGGAPKTLQSPGHNQTALTYEGMKRIKTQTDAVGGITWFYDGEGNPTDVVEASGTTHRIFDELGRVTSCTDIQANTVGYGYDNEKNVAAITYPGGKTVNYTYDGSNRLKTVTDWLNRVTTYYYDTAGRLDHVDRPNNTRQRVVLDNANRLTHSYEEKLSGGTVIATLWQSGYTYYNNNRLWTSTPTPMAKTYSPPSVALTYDDDNRIATYNGQSVSHDLDGNLQSAPVQGTILGAIGWDKRNRLTSAGGISSVYDAENRRMQSISASGTTRFVYSRGASIDRLLSKSNPDGSTTRYVYGTGLLYEETTTAGGVVQNPIYYHYDWRGDTVALSDASGNVTARMSYSAYGELTIESGTVTTPFCFNGQYGVMTEPNGLLYMQARYYSPVLRRFLNEDPSGLGGGLNMYGYCAGDPANLMDPFGLGAIGAIENALVGVAGAVFGPAIGVYNFFTEKPVPVYPQYGTHNPADYYIVLTNGILTTQAEFEKQVASWGGAMGLYNPSHGFVADITQAILQKVFFGVGDSLAAGFADTFAGVDHPVDFMAHSQGTLTLADAQFIHGLPEGSTFTMLSSVLTSYVGGLMLSTNPGGSSEFSTPYFDIINIVSPSLNPVKWASGFVDIFDGGKVHMGNGF